MSDLRKPNGLRNAVYTDQNNGEFMQSIKLVDKYDRNKPAIKLLDINHAI